MTKESATVISWQGPSTASFYSLPVGKPSAPRHLECIIQPPSHSSPGGCLRKLVHLSMYIRQRRTWVERSLVCGSTSRVARLGRFGSQTVRSKLCLEEAYEAPVCPGGHRLFGGGRRGSLPELALGAGCHRQPLFLEVNHGEQRTLCPFVGGKEVASDLFAGTSHPLVWSFFRGGSLEFPPPARGCLSELRTEEAAYEQAIHQP